MCVCAEGGGVAAVFIGGGDKLESVLFMKHYKALKHNFICWRNGHSHTLLTWNTSVTQTRIT